MFVILVVALTRRRYEQGSFFLSMDARREALGEGQMGFEGFVGDVERGLEREIVLEKVGD